MLAEAQGPDPLVSVDPLKTSTTEKDVQDPGIRQRQCGGKHQRQASSQRSCFLGLETRPELVWEDWDLGGEYTKTLVLKNIHHKLQKLHIRPPASKCFSALIPQIIVLSPGTSFSMPVTFRPLQRGECEDNIEFQGKEGSFEVYLRAIIPCHVLEVPDSVMLPLCAVQHSSHTTFLLKNASKLQTFFQFECAAPFQLNPKQGVLKPSHECHIRVDFQPQEALVYQQQAYCWFGEEGGKAENCCTVLLQALAKYPCLQLRNPSSQEEKEHSDPVLQFGSVVVGQCLRKHFDIFNPSPVTVSFSLLPLSSGVPLFGSQFSCDVTDGTVAPGGSQQVTVTYSPAVVNTVSVEYLSINCRGALNEPLLKLTGNCIGPQVSLSSFVVNFGCVEEGRSVVQTIKLINSSPVEVIYQWDIDCNGNSVFSILPASGTLVSHSHTILKAVYRPTQPVAHHRRVACLILHRDPIFLDLIGTCHSELQKPAVLKPEHLVHLSHSQQSSGNLTAVQQEHNGQLDQQGVHVSMKESNQRPGSAAVMPTMDPLFSSPSLSSPHVSVVPSELLFNHKMSSSLSTSFAFSQSVSITNHTRGKLSLVWTVAQDSKFSISPSLCYLAPLKSTSFRVTYDPKQLNTVHGAELECFAYYKDSHDIGEQLVRPPWCVTVRVIGHSFQAGKEHFIPFCSVKPLQVVFPALSVISHRTVLFQNDGDLPLTFCLDHSSIPAGTESLFVEPSCGLIQPRDYQILTLRTTPTEDSPKQGFNLRLQLNAAKLTREITVMSVVEKPCMSLEGGSSLYFQPTAVGSQTQCTHHIRNLSCMPIRWLSAIVLHDRFQWSIPGPDQELIFVTPDGGELHPNESSVQTWSFSPLAEKTYRLNPTLIFWPMQTDGSNKSHLTLKVVGMGSKGTIEAKEAVLDVGEILVGSYRCFEIPLVNNSPCPLSFCLTVQQKLLDDELTYDPETEHSALQLHCERGNIPSHSTIQLQSIVRPHRRAQYLWNISYQTINARGFVSSPPQNLCEVRAKGMFPTLQVIDACGSGSVGRLSKMHLWKLFSLDSLNGHLLSNPSPAELTFRTPTRHSFHSSPSIFTKAMLDFNFSSAVINVGSSDFVLMFYNPGSMPVDWAFLFPEDQQIELEYWAVTGEFSSTELHQMKVQDNQLFSISPRSGTLLPGQKRAVHFSYSHDIAGIHRLPVVFKLSYGREILLNLQGVTVERDIPYLHFSSNQYEFTSVTVGDCSPPRQVYELHNGGAVPIHYEVDMAVLSQLQVDNFNHPVLCCLNPEGEILPGKTTKLEWIFSPLEAKTYHMDVPIRIQDRDSILVRFEGCGLDTLTSSDSKASVPCVQRGPFPGQILFLSEDSVFLGNIPVCSQSSRILFLTNVSYTDTVHYIWDLPQQSNQQVVQIHPERGRLCPGECVLCVLTFTSTDYPTVYQLDLICQVTEEAALIQYHDALQRWVEERERQQDEFTITDKNVTESPRILIDEEPLAAAARTGPPLRKYKTLPPICASSSFETLGSICTRLTKAERRTLRETSKVWRRPRPPQPALLHLAVTAHSHGLLEYFTHFPDKFNKRYRYLQSAKSRQPENISLSTSLPAGLSTQTHGPEKDIHVHILTSLLRNILDDSAFVQSLIPLTTKPNTYQPTDTFSSRCPSFPSSPCPPMCSTSSSSPPATPQRQVLLSGAADKQRTAGGSGNKPEAQYTLQAECVPADMIEDVLLNTLQNLMMEAVRGELVLTAPPCTTISPPGSTRSRSMSKVMAEEENI